MKSYEQMARSVLSRRDQILKRQQQKKVRFFRYAARVSSACAALALCVGAAAIWNNIKDTQKDLDELVRPEETTTQTTVAQPMTENGNNHNNDNNAVQDSTEATVPTEKVIVTSVSKNKKGEEVIVTTEVAVPVQTQAPDQFTPLPPEFVPGTKRANGTSRVTKKTELIGPKPLATNKTTVTKPPVVTKPTGVFPPPWTVTTTKHIPTTLPPVTTAVSHTTVSRTEPPHTEHSETNWTTPPVQHSETTAPTNYVASETTMLNTAPQPGGHDDTPAETTAVKETDSGSWQEPTTNAPNYNVNDLYDSFELNGRYYSSAHQDTYQAAVADMIVYYSGYVPFSDHNGYETSEKISILATPGEYRVVVFFENQNRYTWYYVSSPFY